MSKRLSAILMLLLALLSGNIVRAQLAGGTYTINSAAATGSGNYTSFADAISAMSSGVSGAVTFNVVAGSGPYTEQIAIGSITGASSANMIRFNGNGAIVQYTPTATYTGILMMNGAKYVKFDSLTFKGLSATYGSGAILYNACDYDSITRCVFDLTALTASSSTNYGIRVSTTASSTSSTASGATNTYIGGNRIDGPATSSYGPYYGTYFYGPNAGTVVNNNTISNFYLYGLYDYYGTGITYSNNVITRETKTSVTYCYGLYLYYTGGGSKITGNRVKYLGGATAGSTYCYPFNVMYSTGTAANPIIVSNNIIHKMTLTATYGIRFYYCNYTYLYHNTVALDVPVSYSGTIYGLYQYYNTNCAAKNNIVSITAGGTSTKYGNYFSGNTGHVSDKNDIYVNVTSQAGTTYYGYSGSAYTTLAAFQAGVTGLEANGLSVDPAFSATTTDTLLPTTSTLFNAGDNVLTMVPTDILGMPRAANPTPGAFEKVSTAANNTSLSALSSPTGNFCAGIQQVQATVANAGINNVTSVQVNWILNGITQTPVTYTGTLVPPTATSGLNSAIITLGNGTFNAGANSIKIWTSLPNGTTDSDPTNDTLTATLTTATFAVSATMDTVCTSGTTILSLTPSTGYSTGALEWQSSPNGTTWTTISGTDASSYSSTGLTTATYFRAQIITGGTGCYSPSKQIQLSNPAVLTTTAATRCGVGTLTLGATASTGATLNWYDATSGGTSLSTGTSFTTPTIGTTTTYYVAAQTGDLLAGGKITPVSTSGNSGFSDIGLMFDAYSPFILQSVDVYPISTSSTSGTVTIALKNAAGTTLQSTTANVTVSSSGTLNTVPLNFAVPAGTGHRLVVTAATGMTTLIRESTTTAFAYPYTLPGVMAITSAYTSGASSSYYYYLYNWQVVTGCEGVRTPVIATVGLAPTITASANPTNICTGNTTTINVASANTNYSYNWSTGNTTASFSSAPSATTTYKVTATDATTNCVATDSVVVTVVSQTANITPSTNQTICTGTSTTFTANTAAGQTYQWYHNGILIAGATSSSYTASIDGAFTVMVTNTASGCTATSSPVMVDVVAPPSVTIIPSGNVALCTGSQAVLSGATGTGYTYQWMNGSGIAPGISTNSTYTTDIAGSYSLVVSANGCAVTASPVIISLLPLPVAQMSPTTTTTGCDSVMLETTSTGVSYQWNYNGIPILNANNPAFGANVSGDYSLTITSLVNGCAATTSPTSIVVNQSPSSTITYSSPISFCEGGAVVLNVAQSGNETFQWYQNSVPIADADESSTIAATAGNYAVFVSDITTGCQSASQSVVVRVNPLPNPVVIYDATNNILSTTTNYPVYQWQLNNQPINTGTQATFTPNQNGAYAVIVTDTNGCMNVSAIVFINSVGIQATAVGASVKIYPNPTSGALYVNAVETVDLVVTDVTGKNVLKGNSNTPLALETLADGFYMLYVRDRSNRLIKAEKIMKSSR